VEKQRPREPRITQRPYRESGVFSRISFFPLCPWMIDGDLAARQPADRASAAAWRGFMSAVWQRRPEARRAVPSGARRTPEPDHGLVAMIRQGTFKERGSRDRSDRSPQSFHSRQNRPAWALPQLLVHAYIENHGRYELTDCRHANRPSPLRPPDSSQSRHTHELRRPPPE
jgi:hypothetical protein